MTTMEPTPEQFAEWQQQALSRYAEEWGDNPAFRTTGPKLGIVAGEVARLAYAAGADEQLRSCVRWLELSGLGMSAAHMQDAMRPKTPSLKQQALAVVRDCEGWKLCPSDERLDVIRCALDLLPDD